MKQRIWIVSWYGQSAGGLERIVQILNCILKEQYEVTIIDIPFIQQFKRWRKLVCCENRILLMLTFSAFARWIVGKGDILITHGQNAPFVRSDFLFDHGSIMSLKRQTGEFIYGGSTVFEYIAVKNAKMNIAVSTWTMEQIISNYHVNRNKINGKPGGYCEKADASSYLCTPCHLVHNNQSCKNKHPAKKLPHSRAAA